MKKIGITEEQREEMYNYCLEYYKSVDYDYCCMDDFIEEYDKIKSVFKDNNYTKGYTDYIELYDCGDESLLFKNCFKNKAGIEEIRNIFAEIIELDIQKYLDGGRDELIKEITKDVLYEFKEHIMYYTDALGEVDELPEMPVDNISEIHKHKPCELDNVLDNYIFSDSYEIVVDNYVVEYDKFCGFRNNTELFKFKKINKNEKQ